MSTDGSVPNEAPASYRAERIIASMVMAWVVILTTYMILQNQTLSSESMYFLKIILSLSGAVMLATLPGFLDINYSLSGFSVRAAGGAAAFVFIYTQSPSIPALKLDPASNPPIEIKRIVPAPSGQLSNMDGGLPVLVSLSFDPLGFLLASTRKGSQTYAIYSAGHEENSQTVNSNVHLASMGFGNIWLLNELDSGGGPQAAISTITTFIRSIASKFVALLDRAAELLRASVDQLVILAEDLVAKLGSLTAMPEQLAVLTEGVGDSLDQLTSDVIEPTIISVQTLTETVLHDVGETVGGLTATVLGTTQQLTGDLLGVTQNVVDDVTGSVIPAVDGVLGSVTPQLEKITHRLNEVTPALIIKLDETLPLERSLVFGPQTVQAVTEQLPLQLDGVLESAEIGRLTNLGDGRISFAGEGNDPLGGPLLGNMNGVCNALGCTTGIIANIPAQLNEGLNRQLGATGGLAKSLLGGASISGSGDTGPGGGFDPGSPGANRDGGIQSSGGGGALSSTLQTTKDTVGGLTKGLGGLGRR